jgi:hypothetical protein
MKRYLLDSGPLMAYLHGRKTIAALVMPWITNRKVATSILIYAEVTGYVKGLSDFSRCHSDLRRLLSEIYPSKSYLSSSLCS